MKLVQIIWLDTNETSDSGWCSKEEAEEARPCRVASYGVVVKENDELKDLIDETDDSTTPSDEDDNDNLAEDISLDISKDKSDDETV